MNDQRGCGYGGSMSTSSLRLAFLLGALLAPSSVRADADPVRVLVTGDLDATEVAAAIAGELGVATAIVHRDDACLVPCATITVDPSRVASIHLRGASGTQARTIELPANEHAAAEVVALVIGNLARDESAALLAALAAPTPVAAPTPGPEIMTPEPAATPPPVIVPVKRSMTWRPKTKAAPSRPPEAPTRFSLGFIPPLALDISGSRAHGLAIDLVVGARRRIDAVNIAGVGSIVTEEVSGTQIGGAFTVAGRVDGAQIAGAIAVARDVRGAQIAGAIAVARDVRGAQIAGAVAVANGNAGTQISGGIAVAERVRGAQVSPINIARRVDGVQVGVINVAGAGDGVSVGLLNVVKGGRTELEATLDDHAVGALVLRHGGRRFHNVYGVAARAERSLLDDQITDDDMWMYGLGLGPSWRTGATTIDAEVMAWQVFYGDDLARDLDLLGQLRVVVGHRLGPATAVVGGALNTYVTTDEARQGFGARIAPGAMPPASTTEDVRVEIWPSLFAGVRL